MLSLVGVSDHNTYATILEIKLSIRDELLISKAPIRIEAHDLIVLDHQNQVSHSKYRWRGNDQAHALRGGVDCRILPPEHPLNNPGELRNLAQRVGLNREGRFDIFFDIPAEEEVGQGFLAQLIAFLTAEAVRDQMED